HRHVRLAEIAGTAGVSKATASRALRDPESVSAASRAKVQQALAILGAAGHSTGPGRSGQPPTPEDGGGSPMIALIKPAVSAGHVGPYSRLAEILTNRMFGLRIAVVHIEPIAERNAILAETLLGAEHGGPTVAGAVVVGGGAAGELAGMLAARGLPLIRISTARHDDGPARPRPRARRSWPRRASAPGTAGPRSPVPSSSAGERPGSWPGCSPHAGCRSSGSPLPATTTGSRASTSTPPAASTPPSPISST